MQKPPSRNMQWLVALTGVWFIGGLFVDGWAHIHLSAELETFFTPWHAIFYSGFAANALSILVPVLLRKKRKHPWHEAIPVGYEWAVYGVPLFALGGLGDMAWHTIFGIEIGIEALLSPTHLILAFSGVLMVGGNVRAWRMMSGVKGRSLMEDFPFLISLTTLYSTLTFMTQYAHFAVTRADGVTSNPSAIEQIQGVAIAGFQLQAALLVGLILYVYKRRPLPVGSITTILLINGFGMGYIYDSLEVIMPASIVAGLIGDHLLRYQRGKPLTIAFARTFGLLVPMVYMAVYFAVTHITDGIWWVIHLWAGAIVIAGLAGLLTSMLIIQKDELS